MKNRYEELFQEYKRVEHTMRKMVPLYVCAWRRAEEEITKTALNFRSNLMGGLSSSFLKEGKEKQL